MTDITNQSIQLRKRVLEIRDKKNALENSVESLPTAARTDYAGFIDELGTIAGALERDIEEADDPSKGVTTEQVERLAEVVDEKIDALSRDAAFLALGSPSTIVSLEEKVMESVDGVIEKASELATSLKGGKDKNAS